VSMRNRVSHLSLLLGLIWASLSVASPRAPDNADVKLLVRGQAAVDEIVAQMRNASESIVINMFIWRDDRVGRLMAQEVLGAADRGIKVRISKDPYAVIHEYSEENRRSLFHPTAPRALRLRAGIMAWCYPEEGIKQRPVQRTSKLLQSLMAYKNITIEKDRIKKDHAKYFIFDDRVLILGGVNIEDKEVYRDIQGREYFDYMVRLNGADLVTDFCAAGHTGLDAGRPVRFLRNHRDTGQYPCKAEIMSLLDAATSSITILNAYWGDREVLDKVIAKANAGLDVTVFMAGQANIKNDLNHKLMARLYQATRGRAGIYLSRYMLHAKAMVCDDRRYLVGSCNLNKSSFSTYSEAGVLLTDPPPSFARAFTQSITALKAESRRVASGNGLSYNHTMAWLEGLQESQHGILLMVLGLAGICVGIVALMLLSIRKTIRAHARRRLEPLNED